MIVIHFLTFGWNYAVGANRRTLAKAIHRRTAVGAGVDEQGKPEWRSL